MFGAVVVARYDPDVRSEGRVGRAAATATTVVVIVVVVVVVVVVIVFVVGATFAVLRGERRRRAGYVPAASPFLNVRVYYQHDALCQPIAGKASALSSLRGRRNMFNR